MDERQSTMAHPGRNIARKFLSLLSKRKRDEEKKRMDLRKAMRDSSVERLAAVIASARMEFGDQLNDLCSDAEGVLQRLLREGRPSGTHRKVTLRERLLLADIEASGYRQAGPETSGSERNNCTTRSEISAETPPMLQAVLTLMRPSQAESQAEGVSGSMSQQTVPGGNSVPPNTSGRRLLSALLWEERTVDDADQEWVAFGVSVGAPIHFDHSRSQSARGSELSRAGCHRPSASLGATLPEPSSSTTATAAAAGAAAAAAATTTQGSVNVSSAATSISSVPETPMRVSLMSLLREAEDGSGIIFMNRQMIASPSGLAHDSSSPTKEEEAELMCCVCMGRHKGAAFIPCGHTFCRKCSRELQQARGTCPLCNKEIKDILNLY